MLSAIVCFYPHFEVGKEVGMKMARTLNKLSDVVAKSKDLKPGRHSDGGGLFLNVTATGSRSWLFMWVVGGKRREMGLGAYPDVSLAKAREKAKACREAVAEARDPIAERDKEAEPIFSECAKQFLASMQGQWRNAKHRDQWEMTLTHYCRLIENKKPSAIATDDVLKVLTPIWNEKPETASRLRGRIERVLDFAKAKGWRTGENPALWRGHLKNVLPVRQRLTRGHHSAMAYDAVPAFVESLKGHEAMAARALEFLILTAARSGEVYEAKWQEIDLKGKLWTVPAERMKAGREHRVPLTDAAIAILKPLSESRQSVYVFPGYKADRPLSSMAMTMLMRRMKMGHYTVHGFRSAFRDWAGDATSFPRELAEAALAHVVGDMTERAYRRSDALDKRRKLMEAWSAYCAVKSGGNVVQLKPSKGV